MRVTGAIVWPFAAMALRAGRPHLTGGSYLILPGEQRCRSILVESQIARLDHVAGRAEIFPQVDGSCSGFSSCLRASR